MTPPQHPQEHCGHECVCDDFHPEYDPDYQEVCNNKDCPHDTRSHSSTPAPAPVPDVSEVVWKCVICGTITAKPHEHKYQEVLKQARQQAAAEEREKVLDAVEKCIEEKWFAIETTETERDAVVATEDLEKVLESLRREGEQHE